MDIKGNGADVSRPRIGLMSCRISLTSPPFVVPGCSLSKTGMLFWPRYRTGSGTSLSSTLVASRQVSTQERREWTAFRGLSGTEGGKGALHTEVSRPAAVFFAATIRTRVWRVCSFSANHPPRLTSILARCALVGFIRTQLRMLTLDTVLTRLLIVAFYFPLPARPACRPFYPAFTLAIHEYMYIIWPVVKQRRMSEGQGRI